MREKVVRLKKCQINEAGKVLGKALYNDPAYTYMIPEKVNSRASLARWLCTYVLRYGLPLGHVYTTDRTLKGVAVWVPPGDFPVSFMQRFQVGIGLPFRFGFSVLGRLIYLQNKIEEHHKSDIQQQHWYLCLLGVAPFYHNQGVGSSLLQPILKQADAEGLPCYLETLTEKNVHFYQKHGFEVIRIVDLPESKLRFWTMKRESHS